MVVAEDRHQALDAVEAVEVTYEALPANTVTAKALDSGTNLVLETHHGDKDAVEQAFTRAAHITEMEVPTNLVTAYAIEPRSYLGQYDDITDHYTLWSTTQAPHIVRMFFTNSMKIRSTSFGLLRRTSVAASI